ncbi:Carboxylic ester hydrolase [Mycena chlorophos]|uniref:Carboxylic ester hydrolase n=1 Tax=Mycena chlorophos TaxID=658473 RepID=A0A8H6SHK8_MYCCL|nr:Carboxylic ester hydrolase [Mycena chlorophos]
MVRIYAALFPLLPLRLCWAATVTVNTTSGLLQGVVDGTVMSFKGVRFGQPPVRWEPPVAFTSTSVQNASTLPPACVQQFNGALASLDQKIFNNPSDPPAESEDCLFLNVWAPSPAGQGLPVVLWIYGGGLSFGTGSIPMYDGTYFAQNQSVILVSFNYRTNVFGFPGSPDLALAENNLGFLDQELAMQWVQQNIAQFGGDPSKVTLMGQSAGALSTSAAYVRHGPGTAPFRAAIMFSGPQVSQPSDTDFSTFNSFASALKKVPAADIRTYLDSIPELFRPVVDNVTFFTDPLERIRTGQTSGVPFIVGNMQDDGTLFSINVTSLSAFLSATTNGMLNAADVSPVQALYPGLNNTQVIVEATKDFRFLCPAQLWTAAAVEAGISDVYRYSYGAVFADDQPFPNAGAWHSSELPEVFGTYDSATATAAESTLSNTMQTIISNFIKDPTTSPATNWAKYVPGSGSSTLAMLAYSGNVDMDNVVDAVQSDSLDSSCAFWDQLLDITNTSAPSSISTASGSSSTSANTRGTSAAWDLRPSMGLLWTIALAVLFMR